MGKSLQELVREYGLSNNLFRLQVKEDSGLLRKTIIELDIRRKYGLNILEVRRGDLSKHKFLKTITQKLADTDTQLAAGDILYVTGNFENAERFGREYRLGLLDGHTSEETNGNALDFYDIGIAEIVMMSTSSLTNHTIKEAGFRDKFNVNVLGIRRKHDYILKDLGNEHIHSGDVLLVQNLEQHRTVEPGRRPLGGAWTAARRSRQSNPRLQSTRSGGNHAADGGNDGVRLHSGSSGYIGHHRCPSDGAHRMFPQRRSRLQNHQLGKRCADSRHAAHVAGTGENRRISTGIKLTRTRTGILWTVCAHGRNLLHHLPADHVHQQHSYSRTACAYCAGKRLADRSQSRTLSVCRSGRCKHVLCLSVLHTAQCAGNACRPIHFTRLYKGRASAAACDGNCHDIRASAAFSVLTRKREEEEQGKFF